MLFSIALQRRGNVVFLTIEFKTLRKILNWGYLLFKYCIAEKILDRGTFVILNIAVQKSGALTISDYRIKRAS